MGETDKYKIKRYGGKFVKGTSPYNKKHLLYKKCKRCGVEFRVTKSQYKKKVFCSWSCKKRKIEKICLYCGKHYSISYMHGLKSNYCSKICADLVRKGRITPEAIKVKIRKGLFLHYAGTGNTSGYLAKHLRVRRLKGKPTFCELCGKNDKDTRYEWANKTHTYNILKLTDWMSVCRSCHRHYDILHNNYQPWKTK